MENIRKEYVSERTGVQLVESKNIIQKMQVLGDIAIASCLPILNGEADKRRRYNSKRCFSILGGNKQNRELFICKGRAKYATNTMYNFHR